MNLLYNCSLGKSNIVVVDGDIVIRTLEANSFWKALGFMVYDIRIKGSINFRGMKASNDIFSYKKECNPNMPCMLSNLVESPLDLTKQPD